MKKTKSRGNGEGSIYYREKTKLWAFQYPVGVDPNGKIKRKTVYGKTRKEVIEKSKKMIIYYNSNPFVDKSEMKLRDITLPMPRYNKNRLYLNPSINYRYYNACTK